MTLMRWAFTLCIAWASVAGIPAWAADEPIITEPPVISNKWNATGNRFEISVFPYDATVHNLYVHNPFAAHAAIGYHFFDWLALEAFGGYVFVTGDSQTTEILKLNTSSKDFSLAGLWRTRWFTGGNILWAPFYGKFSLFSELEGIFQIYALLGVGADGLERPDKDGKIINSVRFSGNVGGGFRFFFTHSLAIRAEVRESLGKNNFTVDPNSAGEIQGSTWCQLGLSIFL